MQPLSIGHSTVHLFPPDIACRERSLNDVGRLSAKWAKVQMHEALEALGIIRDLTDVEKRLLAASTRPSRKKTPRKLSHDQVREIRKTAPFSSSRAAAERFNVSPALVLRVRRGERYQDVV